MSNLENINAVTEVADSREKATQIPGAITETRRGTSKKANKITAAAVALLGVLANGGKAEAQQPQNEKNNLTKEVYDEADTPKAPCFWSLEGADQPETTAEVGKKVRISVVTGSEGSFAVPQGWTNDGYEFIVNDPENRGSWGAHKVYDTPGTYNESFAVQGGNCVGEASTKTIIVEAPAQAAQPVLTIEDPNEAHITIAEKEAYDEHLGETADGENRMDIGAGLYVGPNLPTTTSVELGPYLYFLSKLGTKYANLGAELMWSRVGQPIWSELHPQNTMETQRDSYTATLTGGPTLPIDAGVGFDWLEFYLRGAAGITVQHHGQEDIGDDRVVSADTLVLPVIGATGGISLCPTQYLCFTLSGSGQVELAPSATEAGTVGQVNPPSEKLHAKGGVNSGLEIRY